MKICILSMQRVNNTGSLLQAYALKKLLENLGHTVDFIDIKRIDSDYILLGDYKEDYFESEKQGILSKFKKIDKYTINRLRIKSKARVQDQYFEDFRQNFLHISRKHNEYDLCVIGSDEVFNCLNSGSWGFTSQLFGNVNEAKRVITYAASCGATKYENLPSQIVQRIKDVFPRIEGVSVRDNNTAIFVSRFTNKEIKYHLDPVLVWDFNDEIDKVSLPFKESKKYCIVYSYYNRIHNKEEINVILRFCKENNMSIIAVGAPQMWIKEYYCLEPFQVLKLFQNASFVITDTFHGTIFAYKYSKRFAIITRNSNRNKLNSLVKKLHIENHIIDNSNLYSIYQLEHKANPCCYEEQEATIKYLSAFVE